MQPCSTRRVLTLVAACLAPALATAQDAPAAPDARARMSGRWALNPALSQDWRAKIEQSAGPAGVRGGGGRETLLPRGGGEREIERVRLRERIERAAAALRSLEIEQAPGEFKVITGEIDVRIFYIGRRHVRQDVDGADIEVESAWAGDEMVIGEKSERGSVFRERYRWDPAGDGLVLMVQIDNSLLEVPLMVRMVYDRVAQ